MSARLRPPGIERDACGIGFVADVRGHASHDVLERALAGLSGVAHRGAVAADGRTGDGAGVILPLPRVLLPAADCGLAMLFARDEAGVEAVVAGCEAEGIAVLGRRRVPVDERALGDTARASLPAIEQLVLAPPARADADERERRAHRARRRAERASGAYVASLSFRTVTYKALCAADGLSAFYPDLRNPAVEVWFAAFHQRFSTNTAPTWERAQPFRLLCHNGEINTIAGNANWMRARESRLSGADDEEALAPVLDPEGSDSAMLDNALELLVRGGRDVRHALAMLVPEAWRGDGELSEAERAFYRYHTGLVEPWDGPAGLVFTDGRVVGAALDRHGLRPLRYATVGTLVACGSEAGAVPLPADATVRRERLGAGEMLAVVPGRGLEEHARIRGRLARARPYRTWLRAERVRVHPGEPVPPSRDDLAPRHVRAGYTREELSLLVRPAAASGHDAVSSMGDDTALSPLAGRDRSVFSYLRQRFAQVTNPAIDHLRERSMMSLETLLGPRGALLGGGPAGAELVELESFFLYPSALAVLNPVRLEALLGPDETLAGALGRLAGEALAAVRDGAEAIVLRDGRGPEPAIPSLLAVGCVHARLVAEGLRMDTALLVDSEEPRETHQFACLLGYGADAVCPRLALETVAALAAADRLGGDRPSPAEAQRRFRGVVEDGVLKVMSKLGISELASYRGAQAFEAIGLGADVLELCLPGTPSALGGVGLAELEAEARERAAAARAERPQLANPGYVKYRRGGESHANAPDVVSALQDATSAAHALRGAVRADGGLRLYERFAALVNEREPLELRDLLELVPAAPAVPLVEVEPATAIVRRFSGGAMSHGSLSAEAHETVAAALNAIGARSNSGEGGEAPERYGTERRSRIKQVASGRFGVTPAYAADADELQIKIAQGSKPGEGGQLPGHKVTAEIARLRHTSPGVGLISPPPHHDVYSIEDLAQLVFDLRQVNPRADISVKLVAGAGVGVVAAGVVKALADVVHVAGADGGTGASPLGSIKNAGAPWELGLAETQAALVESGLRGRARIRVDGGLKTGRDVLVAALLGADEFSFGTALLLAEGCLMVRSCHLDTCPVGIATQRPELRAKFAATPEQVGAYLLFVAEEARRLLASLGLRSLGEAVGRTELLRPRAGLHGRAGLLDLRPLLAAPPGTRAFADEVAPDPSGGELGVLLAADGAAALEEERVVELSYPIRNVDRTVGALLGGTIGARFGSDSPPGRVRARFTGSAGQSFGAFLAAGVELRLQGEANDYVGKGMGGGRIAIRPPVGDAGEPVLAGNAVLYGATGGELYTAGRAGDRFAVRNSGATAVVEGVGAHACEYMTAGTVVVLGEVGRNFGAGMSGGEAFLHGAAAYAARLNDELVEATPLGAADARRVRTLLERHVGFTGSPRAAAVLDRWEEEAGRFLRIAPRVLAAGADADEAAAAG